MTTLSRRKFLHWLALSALCPSSLALAKPIQRLKVSALQMQPKLGDVVANLAQAEQLIETAAGKGAALILLPEMFTSAVAFDERMLRAIRPIDGEPAQLMKRMAARHQVVVGGSFLAQEEVGVSNSFLLCFPDGQQFRHDKDYPTYWENCYYQGGKDDGVLNTPMGSIGSALCWEMLRSGTVKRLQDRIELLLCGSTWWTLPDEAPLDHPLRAVNLKMLKDAPLRLARMLGVPVIHASHIGQFQGFDSPEIPDIPYTSHYLGESCIVDTNGQVLVNRHFQQGAGVLVAEISLAAANLSTGSVPERFWLPEEMPPEWKSAWERWLPRGRDYYQEITLPYLASGKINEYIPPYMR